MRGVRRTQAFPAGDCDCDGNPVDNDALGVCGGSCEADVDADGICDDAANCTRRVTCSGATDDSVPTDLVKSMTNAVCAAVQAFPAGDCDCDGNQNDALGICGGS